MRSVLLILLSVSVCITAFSQETREERRCRRGQAAEYASRDATFLSMMGWGIGIAIGIALICTLISNNEATTTTNP